MTSRTLRRALERKQKKEEARKLRSSAPESTPTTTTKAETNRANAQFSTGPRTAAGKRASSLNNRKHGFRGDFFLAPAEDPAEWEDFKEQLAAEWDPLTETESNLVQMLAENFWLRKRAQMLATVTAQRTDLTPDLHCKQMNLYQTYANRHERAYHKCRKELEAIRAARQAEAIGFERQIAGANQEHRRAELHKLKLQTLSAKLDHQHRLASNVQNNKKAAKPKQPETESAVTITSIAGDNGHELTGAALAQ